MMMHIQIGSALAAVLLGAVSLGCNAVAQDRENTAGPPAIAAVVNNEAISVYDLGQRIGLIGLGGRVPTDAAQRRRLSTEVLRAMVTERLQVQEAQRLGVAVTEREVADQWVVVEQRSRLGKGDLAKLLKQRNIDPRTLEDQIRASLAWAKVVGRAVQPQIRVTDSEVNEVLSRYKTEKDRWQYRLQEIFIAVDPRDQDAQALRAAQVVLGHLRAGAAFDAVARQFSQTGTGAAGGDMGWLFEGQIDAELERAVKQLKTGQIAGPIRGIGGYYIVRLADRRQFGGSNPDVKTVPVAQASFALRGRPAAQAKEIQDKAAKLAAAPGDCDAFVKAAQAAGAGEAQLLPDLVPERLPPNLRILVNGLKPNQASRPIPDANGVMVVMRCAETADRSTAPGQKEVRDALTQQKLRAFADRYLKELRRSAFVDIRV